MKKTFARFAASLLFGLVSSSGIAQSIDGRCKDSAYTSREVEQIQKMFARVVDAVEMVPPDEAEYIRSESRKAIEQRNKARFNAVAARRFYAAFQFHEEAKVATQNLEAASRASGRELARYLVVVLSRLGDVQERLPQYVSTDEKRPQPVLSEKIRSDIYFSLPVAKHTTVNLLQCVVSAL